MVDAKTILVKIKQRHYDGFIKTNLPQNPRTIGLTELQTPA